MSRGLNIAWLALSIVMATALCVVGKPWPAAMFAFIAGARTVMALGPRA